MQKQRPALRSEVSVLQEGVLKPLHGCQPSQQIDVAGVLQQQGHDFSSFPMLSMLQSVMPKLAARAKGGATTGQLNGQSSVELIRALQQTLQQAMGGNSAVVAAQLQAAPGLGAFNPSLPAQPRLNSMAGTHGQQDDSLAGTHGQQDDSVAGSHGQQDGSAPESPTAARQEQNSASPRSTLSPAAPVEAPAGTSQPPPPVSIRNHVPSDVIHSLLNKVVHQLPASIST